MLDFSCTIQNILYMYYVCILCMCVYIYIHIKTLFQKLLPISLNLEFQHSRLQNQETDDAECTEVTVKCNISLHGPRMEERHQPQALLLLAVLL